MGNMEHGMCQCQSEHSPNGDWAKKTGAGCKPVLFKPPRPFGAETSTVSSLPSFFEGFQIFHCHLNIGKFCNYANL